MQTQGQRAPAAREHAVDSTAAVSIETVAMSGGLLGAAARVSLATTASQQLAKRPQSLAWLSAEA